jgi:microcystin-dependent protein
MAERQPPLYAAGGCYTSEDFRSIFDLWDCAEGALSRNALKVESAGGMNIVIRAGAAFVFGDNQQDQGKYLVTAPSDTAKTLANANGVFGRRDRVVALLNDPQYTGIGTAPTWTLTVLTGTPTASPSLPALPDTALPLAEITVPATASTPSVILDTRPLCAGDDSVPVGVVLAFVGALVPEGYLLCNGQTFSELDYPTLSLVRGGVNTVPDLRGTFLAGAGGGEIGSLGEQGGDALSQLNLAHMIPHTHTAWTGFESANHFHGVFGGIGNENLPHSHPDFDGGYLRRRTTAEGWEAPQVGTFSWGVGGTISFDFISPTNENQAHSHLVNLNTGGISSNHAHAVGVSVEGGGEPFNNLPPYEAVHFIIKARGVGE